MTLDDWLEIGQDLGFCGPPRCVTHLDIYTPEEMAAFDAGEDPCINAVRLLEFDLVVNLALVQ